MVRTDYQGLGTMYDHQYLVGVTEGHSVLDMVRAARQAAPRQLSADIAIAGHSQGGHAALFAAAEAPRYTPELHLAGTVAFAPASHLDEQIPLTTSITQPNAGLTALVATIAQGLDSTYGKSAPVPGTFDPSSVLAAPGLQLATDATTMCLPDVGTEATKLGLTPAAMFKPGVDFTPIRRLLDVNDPSNLRLRTPLRIEQGTADTTVIPLFTDQLATDLKANGEQTLTYNKVAGIDHAGVTAGAGATDATKYLKKLLKP